MITTARIKSLKDIGGLGWLTALGSPQIAVLAADTGPLQTSLFDEQNFARDQPPRLPRRTAHRLPEPRPGRAASPETERTAGRHRGRADPDPGRHHRGPTAGRRQDRAPRREGPGQTQDGQTLPAHHHRHHAEHHPGPTEHRRRNSSRRHLRTPHHHPRRASGHRRGDRRLQEPRERGEGLPLPQGHRHRPTTRPALPGQSPRVPVFPGRVPHLAPPPGPRRTHQHRRKPTHQNRSRRTRRQKPSSAGQEHHPEQHRRATPCTPTKVLLTHFATLTRNDAGSAAASCLHRVRRRGSVRGRWPARRRRCAPQR